jgi:hypothetical protein
MSLHFQCISILLAAFNFFRKFSKSDIAVGLRIRIRRNNVNIVLVNGMEAVRKELEIRRRAQEKKKIQLLHDYNQIKVRA